MRKCSGFTLIELLVVVAVISLLMSILLPSLECAREQARRVVCGTTLSSFGKGLTYYVQENSEFLPGVNTSGYAMQKYWLSGENGQAEAFTDASMPVQNYDWITPIIRYSDTELPAKRAERWAFFWQERYACPSVGNTQSVLYNPNSRIPGPEREDFKAISWRQNSYLMPTYFQLWGDRFERWQLGGSAGQFEAVPVSAKLPSDSWERNAEDFRSRLTQVGPLGRKLFVSDGTRYLDRNNLPLDHDAKPIAGSFGAFTESGAWRSGATAFGVRAGSSRWGGGAVSGGSPSEGRNLPLSYRHGCSRGDAGGDATRNQGEINGLFFDGHVDSLNDRDSREPHLWFPSGAKLRNLGQVMVPWDVQQVVP